MSDIDIVERLRIIAEGYRPNGMTGLNEVLTDARDTITKLRADLVGAEAARIHAYLDGQEVGRKDMAAEVAGARAKDADDEDMAAVGRSLMDSIATLINGDTRFKHWAPAQDPAEIVFDIVNMMDDAQAEILGALKRYSEIWCESLIDPALGDEARAIIAKYSPDSALTDEEQ